MAKHEPWYVPRPDEDGDDALLDWLGKKQDPPKKGAGCPFIALPVVAGLGLALTLLRRKTK